jgi:uncharacterized protein YbjT (DUF2867 family)
MRPSHHLLLRKELLMYIITGATGNTGRPIALGLLAAGRKVRVVVRNAEKAKDLADRGADVAVGDLRDPGFLRTAFKDGTAVYAMVPPEYTAPDFTAYQRSVADAIAGALPGSGVTHVVSLSSVGAHLTSGAGVVAGLHHLEQALNRIPGLNVLHLRPTYFMENLFAQVDVIRHMGVMGSPVKADLTMNMIATKDIAAYALRRLQALDFTGSGVQFLLGQRDITYREVAAVIGPAIGKPALPYVEVPDEEFRKALMGMGASASMAECMLTFTASLNAGRVLEGARRSPESTTPTSIEEFSQTFARVLGSGS